MNTKLLRQKILDLAIRGKLTEQKKSDGTTKDLLASIAASSACHAELVSASPSSSAKKNSKATERSVILEHTSNVIASEAKQSKKSKPTEPKTIIPLNKDEAPFEIPENWEWVRLGDLCSSVSSGKTPSTIQKELWNGDILWVTSKDVKQKYIHSTQVCLSELGAQTMRLYPENTMIIVGRSGILRHTLPVSILKHDATINQDLKALIFKDDNLAEYIHAAIKGMEQDLLHRYKKAGTTVDNLNFDEFLLAGIPLPPLAEQKRIVEAIESAFAEITAIENNQELLKKHIKQGRQKILDLAIRGKLTQQLKTDGATKDLLAQISKQWLVSSKQDSQKENASFNVIASATSTSSRTPIRDPFAASKNSDDVIASTAKQSKKTKPAEPKQIIPLDKTTAPFEIPETWEWVKYGDVVTNISVKENQVKSSEIHSEGLYPVVSQGQNYVDGFVDDFSKIIHLGNIPIVLFGDHTRVVKYIDFDFVVGADGTKVLKPLTIVMPKYLYYSTMAIVEKIEDRGYGRHYALLSNSMFALPPLAEQKRIVEAIESAFTEFDAMEKL